MKNRVAAIKKLIALVALLRMESDEEMVQQTALRIRDAANDLLRGGE